MRNVFLKSNFHMRFENGEMTKGGPTHIRRDVYAVRDEENSKIYHVYIKDPENGNYLMEPKAMKIINDEIGMKITLEGITLNDPDNIWGFDFSDYGIQFIASAMTGMTGQPGTASLLLKDRNILIVYQ